MTESTAAKRERGREASRRWRERNPERVRERQRRWRENNLELARERGRATAHKIRHGATLTDKTLMLEAQGGCCYLCGDEITLETSALDHDHRCDERRSCQYCRRGVACHPCNKAVGLLLDDPARLRRIADNLEIALALVNERLDGKPEQLNLL